MPYTYTSMTQVQYAASLIPSPPVTTYMPLRSMQAILPSGARTTSWARDCSANDHDDPYGQAEWNSRWDPFYPNVTISTFPISTTVKPTPIPSSSLLLPPDSGFAYKPANHKNPTFPPDFIFGAASAAAQIEGAIQAEGRTPSVADYFFNFQPQLYENNYITDWNYYLYKEDIARMAAIGLQYYSFSISWNRILPFGAAGTPINKEGVEHYNDLINTCLEYGIKPMVTMVHEDEPYEFIMGEPVLENAYFSRNAGASNSTFVESFVNYAKVLFANFGDRVPIWITINEAIYDAGNLDGLYNLLEAHTQIYDIYKAYGGKGKISHKMSGTFAAPMNPNNQSDVEAANRYQDFLLGILANPQWLGIDIPESVSSTLTNDSHPLTKKQLARYKGKCDFYGIDAYTASIVTQPPEGIDACAKNPSNPLWPTCVVQTTVTGTDWQLGFYSDSYPFITPTYFRAYMNWLWDTYHPNAIMMTEFGFPVSLERDLTLDMQRNDLPRSLYYESYLTEMLNLIHEDGVNMIGAIAWTMLDNWEWGSFDPHFGMQAVNRTTMERTYKRSFFDYVEYFHAHGL
ncbi:beta-glucosidase 1A [Penicillium riverlandense]|uniref:beta-glucosidase 1A n=1 Tax=Penicillium riverlandense TaxID=1903569 RepID=UPI002547BAF8|nr:beta-glucosidase 1A [Penicillium riverlandense]KAJ5808778.1 beta-glucosidase 1A [Penicillium riverlandense]